jgi:recombination protein RecA
MTIKETVYQLYEQGLTNLEISQKTGLTKKQIISGLYKYNLKSNRYTKVIEDENLKQFIIGSMLGDGTITKVSGLSKHSRFSVAHKSLHKEYIEFKFNFLAKYNLSSSKISEYKIFNERYKEGFYEEVRFKSSANPYFSVYRELFYPEDVKIIPSLLESLNSFGLAIWFMDDGSVTNVGYNLATNGFTLEDVKYLQNIIKNNFNINTSIQKSSGRYKIYIGHKETDNFKNIISPYIIPCMEYKLYPYKKRS